MYGAIPLQCSGYDNWPMVE